jgi:diguanylate cyclase (GGDEF)-like protein/PAS domain S-box-containing protein
VTTQNLVSSELLSQAINQSHDGITIADATQDHWPLIYVNSGFERLSGYSAAELLGKTAHHLLGTDTEQTGVATLRESLKHGNNCQVTLRNYRRDGSMFWNELIISAVRDASGALTHFIGIAQDVTVRILLNQQLHQSNLDLHTLNQQLHTLSHLDPLIGVSNKSHFDEQLAQMLQTSQRTHSQLSVLKVDLDQFKRFNDRYGRPAGDVCLRMVGEYLAKSFARASDCVSRYDDDEFAIVSMGATTEGLQEHVGKLRDHVRALSIPHSDSPYGVVTICVGGISLTPPRDATTSTLLKQADTALHEAKRRGPDCEYIV